ncbi:GtrA family protein [Streptomyces sp. NPDC054796]
MGERRSLRSRVGRLARELAKFGAVGAVGFLVNVAVFNLCMHSFQLAPVRSGVISQVVAIGTNYLGNRYWTYRHIDKSRVHRETSLFFLFSGIGLVLENGILALSHYGFGFTSTLADNIAKNVVGLGIGTVFRFWSYRTWVFRDAERLARTDGDADRDTGTEAEAGAGAETVPPDGATRVGARSGGRVRRGLSAKEKRENRRVLLK